MTLASAVACLNTPNTSFDDQLSTANLEPMLSNLYNVMPDLLPHIPTGCYFRIAILEEIVSKKLSGTLTTSDIDLLRLLVWRQELRSMVALQKKLDVYLTFRIFPNGKHFRKKTPEETNAFDFVNRESERNDENVVELTSPGASPKDKSPGGPKRAVELQEAYRLGYEAAQADAMRKAEQLKEKLESTEAKLAKITMILSTHDEDLSPQVDDEMLMLKEKLIKTCEKVLKDLEDSRRAEKKAIEDLVKKNKEIEEISAQLQKLRAERDQLQSSVEFSRETASSFGFNGPPSSFLTFPTPQPVVTLNRNRMLTVKLNEYQQMKKQLDDQGVAASIKQIYTNCEVMFKDEQAKTRAKKRIDDFRKEFGVYMALLEYNIKTMIESPSMRPDNLIPLPELPNFASRAFFIDFEVPMKQLFTKGTRKPASVDNGCVICFDDIEKKNVILKCGVCKQPYHKKCIFKYLQDHTDCPICMSPMCK